MNTRSRYRPVGFAVFLAALTGFGCSPSQSRSLSESSATRPNRVAPTAGDLRAHVIARAPDAFYEPPADVPDRPGVLLRSEPLTRVILPAGMEGWRILYTTTVDDNTPATAVATVFAPANVPAGPLPVITWEHGTTGVLQKCMPSLTSVPTEGIPARDQIVKAGWAVVATDYSFAEQAGPHPYIIGEGEARAALDSIRAARQMPELVLDDRTVVWGHSQGGHAALWTGIIGPRYAPDVRIAGVAGIAPAADIKALLEMNVAANKRLGPYLALSYSRFYPDITFEQALRPEALGVAREMVGLCRFIPPEDPQRIAALAATFDGPSLAAGTNKALAARLEQNTPQSPIASAVLIAQGLADRVVPATATDAFVGERCAAGQRLEYWRFARRDHGTIVQPGTPLEEPLVAWTKARFADRPQASGCARKSF